MEFQKGTPIRFVAGKYAGLTGWRDASKTWGTDGDNETSAPVIVDQTRGKGLKSSVVSKGSFREILASTTAGNYADLVIENCPDIEKDLVAVTRKLAKCNAGEHIDDINGLLVVTMADAVDWQSKLTGAKAATRNFAPRNKANMKKRKVSKGAESAADSSASDSVHSMSTGGSGMTTSPCKI
ncbi:unnamed protein product [Cylindrotheca closterium]|uniref:Uncharacterized protein n=1 Tax=Cylindrotheca closterium TaxID=2856 RepID=A0AAD2CKY0_9STRA|nr:unnamed protein product [Cylindrotheca closterium]